MTSVFLVGFLPVMGAIAVPIKLDSSGPVFVKQSELGNDGKPFQFCKFRSMYHNVDDSLHREYLKRYVTKNNTADGEKGVYGPTNDERATRVGRFIRKYILDEIPQLWNVLSGHLFLIGPRHL